ncbi:MAG TPA: hypothetical protein VMR33_10505 [Candidatus Baltobacteraceae bacterium]|nr:hypothetical protein [Candidatus Baltobacteraceae bacterium]
MKINDSQRGLSWIFVVAIVLSICDAPWEKSITTQDLGQITVKQQTSSILEPPPLDANGCKIRLRNEVLAMEWVAALLIYGAAFVALADKPPVTSPPQKPTAK